MLMAPENAEHYEVGEPVVSDPRWGIYQAREVSVGTPCLLHRFNFHAETSDTDRAAMLQLLRRYASLQASRTPRLVDGWIADHHLGAIEYRYEALPVSYASNNPFRAGGAKPQQIIESTLWLLTAMHRAAIVHGDVRPETFGTAGGKIYLMDTGIDKVLLRCLYQDSGSGLYSLSDNLSSQDVASWALIIIGLMKGEAVMQELMTERWDDYDLGQARKVAEPILRKPELVDFFMKCLRGFTNQTPTFESAIDAQKYWASHRLWSLWS